MASQYHKGDIVMCIAGEFAGQLARVKKINRHLMVFLDVDPALRKLDPQTGKTPQAKTPIDCIRLAQERLISHG